jgi:hypothetical protein
MLAPPAFAPGESASDRRLRELERKFDQILEELQRLKKGTRAEEPVPGGPKVASVF